MQSAVEESEHNKMFQLWLDEAIKAGIVLFEKEPPCFELTPTQKIIKIKKLVTKEKKEERTLFQPMTYTPDFYFYWNPEYLRKFFTPYYNQRSDDADSSLFIVNRDESGAYFSLVDVKAEINRLGQSNSDITFPLKQKILFAHKGLFVQKMHVIKRGEKGKSVYSDLWIPQKDKHNMFYKRNTSTAKKGDVKYPWTYRYINDVI